MTKICLGRLTCWETTSGPGDDDVYAKIFVDGHQVSRWPTSGDCEMGKGDQIDMNLILDFNRELKLEFWEADSWGSDDYLGASKFHPGIEGEGEVEIRNSDEGNIYKLQYQSLAKKIKTLRLESLKCVMASASTDADVIDSVMGLTSKASEAAAAVLEGVPNPKAQLIGKALKAASDVFEAVPKVAQAIEASVEYPDQLYITNSNQSGTGRRIWPGRDTPADTIDIRTGQMVRFDNIRFALTKAIDLSFWEWDVIRDDFLGSFSVDTDKPEGVYVDTVCTPKEISIYLIAYRVSEETW